jgi:hypothetical protein
VRKSIALFFLLVFSISQPGFSVELHFCEGKITDVAVFGHAACRCENPQEPVVMNPDHQDSCEKHCHKTELEQTKKSTGHYQKACCKTEKLTLTSAKLKALSSLKTSQVVMLAAAILNPYAITAQFAQTEKQFAPYIPPLIERDLTILHRVFII